MWMRRVWLRLVFWGAEIHLRRPMARLRWVMWKTYEKVHYWRSHQIWNVLSYFLNKINSYDIKNSWVVNFYSKHYRFLNVLRAFFLVRFSRVMPELNCLMFSMNYKTEKNKSRTTNQQLTGPSLPVWLTDCKLDTWCRDVRLTTAAKR